MHGGQDSLCRSLTFRLPFPLPLTLNTPHTHLSTLAQAPLYPLCGSMPVPPLPAPLAQGSPPSSDLPIRG